MMEKFTKSGRRYIIIRVLGDWYNINGDRNRRNSIEIFWWGGKTPGYCSNGGITGFGPIPGE
jgi:hypothetical protein